jgi:hypothetical protein
MSPSIRTKSPGMKWPRRQDRSRLRSFFFGSSFDDAARATYCLNRVFALFVA